MESYGILFFFFPLNSQKSRTDLIPNHAYRNTFSSCTNTFFFTNTSPKDFSTYVRIYDRKFFTLQKEGRKISKHKKMRIAEIRLPFLRRLHVSFFFFTTYFPSFFLSN